MRSQAPFAASHPTLVQDDSAGFLAPRYVAALRTITEGPPAIFQPKPLLEVYRSHYDRVAAHNHFLFGLVMRTAFVLQRALGIRGDATIAIQAVNAVSAAIAGGLFFLLALRLGVPREISLAVEIGRA